MAMRKKTIQFGLGRPTLRGVRRCHKCGTVNGTRGLSCKNRFCDVVFKEAGEKTKHNTEACKLDTGNSTRLFSVRVRDKGPDYRGFVQLPILQPDLSDTDSAYLSQVSAVCFVDSCQRSFNAKVLKCHERAIPMSGMCPHVELATRCSLDAKALRIDNEALKSLNIPTDIKEEIWRLNSETPGSLVQRVSKSVMVVRCNVTTKDPLGFLHVSFFLSSKNRENHSICSCASSNPDKMKYHNCCVHYYSCIAAFASDVKCNEEFYFFVEKEKLPESYTIEISSGVEVDEEPLVAILSDTIGDDTVEVEVLQKDLMLEEIAQDLEGLTSVVDGKNDLVEDALEAQALESLIEQSQEFQRKIRVLPKSSKKKPPENRKLKTKRKPESRDGRKILQFPDAPVDETRVQMTFIEWLSSVTERINQSMHYQFEGKPEPLVFHVPHKFFDCLVGRLMSLSGARRKRLPNQMTTFTRKTAPPLGTFQNYTWYITNVSHAKSLFDTPMIQLNITKSFIKKFDGTFEDYNPNEFNIHESVAKKGQQPLKPVEYRTYLKIGNIIRDQEAPFAMAIDWTPDVLPMSQIGELKITFEYGHSSYPPSAADESIITITPAASVTYCSPGSAAGTTATVLKQQGNIFGK